MEAEQGCLKNEPDEKEAENADHEKAEDESLKPDGEDDEPANNVNTATSEDEWKGLDSGPDNQFNRAVSEWQVLFEYQETFTWSIN